MPQRVPVVPRRGRSLMQPLGERIFFAGEHLAGPLIQTCGGARLSGEAVAGQVASQLATHWRTSA
jgi:monoamine oxidase